MGKLLTDGFLLLDATRGMQAAPVSQPSMDDIYFEHTIR